MDAKIRALSPIFGTWPRFKLHEMVSRDSTSELWRHDVHEFQKLLEFANEEQAFVPSYGCRRIPKPTGSIKKGLTAWQNDAGGIQQVIGREAERGLLIFPPMRLPASRKGTSAARRELRALLETIASNSGFNQDVSRRVNEELKSVEWDIHMLSHAWRWHATVTSLSQWFCFGLSRLQMLGLDNAVGLCELPDCGRFFLRWPNQPGKARKFCSKSHGDMMKNRKAREKKQRQNKSRGMAT